MRAPRLSPLFASSALALTACASAPTGPAAPPSGYGCHSEGPAAGSKTAAADPGLLTGLGDVGFPAEHVGERAAPYFAETVQLTHAFNAFDAMRTAVVAQRLQPDCAMCFWADAWAQGPTINYTIDAGEEAKARAAALKAKALATGLSDKAQGLIDALLLRYPAKPLGKDPASDDKAYAAAMVRLADRFPGDDALSTEAASSLLIASGKAWSEGVPKPGSDTARAEARLEQVLARAPNYTPAIHFYIHLEEWTRTPEKAAPYAERLAALAPNAGHLVHMPSHLWFRMGRYEAGASANSAAAQADDRTAQALAVAGGTPNVTLHVHNVAFGLASALMSGDRDQALSLARRTVKEFPKNPGVGLGLKAWQVFARDLPVADVLALPEPVEMQDRAFRRYARGLALAWSGDPAGARRELAAFQLLAKDASVAKGKRAAVSLMTDELTGHILLAEGKPAEAVAPLRRAADLRDREDEGMDPPIWGWPPRRALAAALLAKGDAAGAAKELQRSLDRFKGDPVALYALSEAKRRSGAGAAEADRLRDEAKAAWKGAPTGLSLARV